MLNTLEADADLNSPSDFGYVGLPSHVHTVSK